MNWGKSIVIAFVLFAFFIGILVAVCVRQDIALVSKNYYQEELRYGEQMQRIANAERLAVKPQVRVNSQSLIISYEDFPMIDSCEVKFIRPSDSRHDKRITINRSENKNQSVDVTSMRSGMYRVRLTWSMKGKTYFIEEVVVI